MFWSAGGSLKGQKVWLTDKYPGGQKLTDSDPEHWLLEKCNCSTTGMVIMAMQIFPLEQGKPMGDGQSELY